MMWDNKRLILGLFIFLFCNSPYLLAQEKVDATEKAQQHYQRGIELYSQGQYQEANSEFDKAIELLSPPRIEFKEKIEKEQEKAIAPAPSQPTQPSPQEKLKKKEEEGEKEEAEVTEKTAVSLEAVAETEVQEEREYHIDIGDILDISVWQIADLSRSEVIVRPDGKLSLPLIGDIKAEGLTLTQLDSVVTEKFKTYVKAPEVSVMIRRFGEAASKVIVLGEIFIPGVFKFASSPTITEVIASAGGYTKYAVLNSIMVIRGDVRTKPEVIRVDMAQILKSGRLSENIFLKPNDIIYVPRSFIGKVNTFLEVFQPAIGEYLQTLNARHLHHVVRGKGGI